MGFTPLLMRRFGVAEHVNEELATPVPPAMQRASSEAQFNVVGDELRKSGYQMFETCRQFDQDG